MFHVGLTRDFLRPDGTLVLGDIGLSLLDGAPEVKYEFLADDRPELAADQVREFDALVVLAPRVTAATLRGADRLSVLARFGVGYDTVDVDACTAEGVLLTITPDGVRRPVASSVIAFLLALTHRLLAKDRLTRAGRWTERSSQIGVGLRGRVLGIVGLGNIGREVARLAHPFDLRVLAADPYVTRAQAAEVGAELVDLATLLRTSDFVSLNCALTADTRHLLDAERLALMKPTAFLINTARGPIVDQTALTAALREGRIQGAALDVFEQEPIDPDDSILGLDNVIVAPHAICWTDESLRETGRSACQSVLDVAAGRIPRHVVNRAVLGSPTLEAKLRRYGTARRACGSSQVPTAPGGTTRCEASSESIEPAS
jgi:D-3-phosphoglycerate dehydrogenase